MKYFHVTTMSNWEKIKNEGLIPCVGARSQKIGESFPAVFLFESEESMRDAMWGWLGEEFEDSDEADEAICLKVELPEGFPLDEGVSCEYEVRSYQKIPPEYISFYTDEL